MTILAFLFKPFLLREKAQEKVMRMQILRITGEFNFTDNRKGEKCLPSFSLKSQPRYLQNIEAHTFAGLNLIFWKSFDLCYRISIRPGIAGSPQSPPVCYWPFLHSFSQTHFVPRIWYTTNICLSKSSEDAYEEKTLDNIKTTVRRDSRNGCPKCKIRVFDNTMLHNAYLQCTHYAAFLPRPVETLL